MKKFDNKGFALVETLVVSVFVVSLFLIIFNNFYPLMSEYEKREAYDDIDGVYAAYWVKRLVEDSDIDIDIDIFITKKGSMSMGDLCDKFNGEKQQQCENIFNKYNINFFYVTDYNIKDFKSTVDKSDPDFEAYLNSLPDYSNSKNNTYSSNFRVIVGMKRKYTDIENNSHEYMAYSNMEGNK